MTGNGLEEWKVRAGRKEYERIKDWKGEIGERADVGIRMRREEAENIEEGSGRERVEVNYRREDAEN